MMKRILVIEDEKAIRANLVDLLELENFDVLEAENGAVGIELAKAKFPDLIICDVIMPDVDGYTVLQTLRQNPITAIIPFLFLTAKTELIDLRHGMNLGADDYLTKPFKHADLLTAIATRLSKKTAIQEESQQNLNALRSSITLALPHELKTPLTGILGYSDYLIDFIEKLDPQEIKEIAGSIKSSATRLQHLIKNFLVYTDLQVIELDLKQIQQIRHLQTPSAKLMIQRIATSVAQHQSRLADLYLDLHDAEVQIPPAWLEKIVVELIDNALKYSDSSTPIQVNSTLDAEHFILYVANQGRGMSPSQIDKIGAYMQFDRAQYEQQGVGLGLIIAKKMVDLCGGTMSIASEPDQQTIIQITLLLV